MVPMKALAALFAEAGCDDVQTFIQSGNVVFHAGARLADALEGVLEAKLSHQFGFEIPLVLRSSDALRSVADNNPFLHGPRPEPEMAHVLFLAKAPIAKQVAALDPGRSPPDELAVRGREVYLRLPNGVGRSKLTNAYFDRALGTMGTMRNWRTVLALLALAGS